jgi:hypothetical protein
MRFTQLQQAAGQRPMAFERLSSAPYQQNPALLDHYRANRHQRRRGKLSLHESSALQSNPLYRKAVNRL